MTDKAAELIELAEHARRLHYLVSTHADPTVNNGDSEIYKASRAMFSAAISAAYPDLDRERIENVWLDCNESIAYCVDHIRHEMEDEGWEAMLAELTDDEYDIADRVESVLASVTADGLPAQFFADSLRRPVAEVRGVLRWMVGNKFMHTTGHGASVKYHAGRA